MAERKTCYLLMTPAEPSQKGQHQSAKASGSGKASHTAAKHGKDGQTQHQEGALHHQVFLEECDVCLIKNDVFHKTGKTCFSSGNKRVVFVP